MPAPRSSDLRERIVRAVEGGSSVREAARRFEVSASAAIKLVRRVRETGSAAPAEIGGHRPRALAGHEAELVRLVETTPDITLAELQAELERRCGLSPALSTLHRTLRGLGLRHKKVPAGGRRTRPARCGGPAPPLASLAALHGSRALRLSRRDRHGHQHGKTLRALPLRGEAGRRRATRPLAGPRPSSPVSDRAAWWHPWCSAAR
jgi:putative transposase